MLPTENRVGMNNVVSILFAVVFCAGFQPLCAKNTALEKNVKLQRNGEIYINNIPQVYSRKSYSSMGVVSMVLRYFDRKISLDDLYDVFSNTRNDEGISTELLTALKRNFSGFEVTRLYTLTPAEADALVNAYNDTVKKRKSKQDAPESLK